MKTKNKKIIFDYIDGRLTDKDIEEFNAMLQQDAELEREFSFVRSVVHQLRESATPPLNPNYLHFIKQRLHSSHTESRKQSHILRPAFLFFLPLFIVVSTFYIIHRESLLTEPVQQSFYASSNSMQDYLNMMSGNIENTALYEIVTEEDTQEAVDEVFLKELQLDDTEAIYSFLSELDISFDEFITKLSDEQVEELLIQLDKNEGYIDEQ